MNQPIFIARFESCVEFVQPTYKDVFLKRQTGMAYCVKRNKYLRCVGNWRSVFIYENTELLGL